MPPPPDWEALFCWEDVEHWGDDLQLHLRENTHTHTHRKTTAVPASMMTNHTSFCQRHSDSKKHPLKIHVQHTLAASNTPLHYLSLLLLLLPHFWGLIWSLFPPSHTPPANSHLEPTENIIFLVPGAEFINMRCSLGPDIAASNETPLEAPNLWWLHSFPLTIQMLHSEHTSHYIPNLFAFRAAKAPCASTMNLRLAKNISSQLLLQF